MRNGCKPRLSIRTVLIGNFLLRAHSLRHNAYFRDEQHGKDHQEEEERRHHATYGEIRQGGTNGQQVLDGPRLTAQFGHNPTCLTRNEDGRNAPYA